MIVKMPQMQLINMVTTNTCPIVKFASDNKIKNPSTGKNVMTKRVLVNDSFTFGHGDTEDRYIEKYSKLGMAPKLVKLFDLIVTIKNILKAVLVIEL